MSETEEGSLCPENFTLLKCIYNQRFSVDEDNLPTKFALRTLLEDNFDEFINTEKFAC